MSADKHPADVLADTDARTLAEHLAADRAWLRDEYEVHIASMLGAERQLQRIPALEAERDQLRAEVTRLCIVIGGRLDEIDQLRAEVEALRADKDRIDWLADPENTVGNVQLPREVVEANLHSLRDAIDAARKAGP